VDRTDSSVCPSSASCQKVSITFSAWEASKPEN
jgi:hypothetical protein